MTDRNTIQDEPGPTGERAGVDWTPEAVQRLRASLRLSQTELAARIGTRQQTISEWETGTRAPRRMSRRLLHLVAEESGFYALGPADIAPSEGGPAGQHPALERDRRDPDEHA